MSVEGLKIRLAEPDDCSAFYEIFSSPKVYLGTLQLPYPSREQWRQRIGQTEGVHTIVAVVDGQVVGFFSVHTFPHKPRKAHVGSIAIAIHEQWQAKGVGTALMQAGLDLADNWLNLVRLQLEVYTDNEPAIRLYERFGFEREGTLRMDAFRDGKYADSYVMGRLRHSRDAQ